MNKPFKWALHINFFVYAILLNSVGIVILKSINNYGVSEVQASRSVHYFDHSKK